MQYRKEYTQRPIDHATQTIIVEGEHIQFPSPEQCTSLLDSSVGTHLFPLTPFSAKKIEGKKLYEYARA